MGEPDLEKPGEKEAREKAYWENQKKVCDNLTPIDANLKKIKEYILETQDQDPMYDANPPSARGPDLKPAPCPSARREPNQCSHTTTPFPLAALCRLKNGIDTTYDAKKGGGGGCLLM